MKKIVLFVIAVFVCGICFSQPPNDDPCGAIPLIVETGTNCSPDNPYSWAGATASAGIPAPGCGSYSTGDIWFSFISPASGKVNISTAEGSGPGAIYDGAMTVYGSGGSCSDPFFYVLCDDDSGPGNMPYLSLALTPGVAYYIRFWDYYDATSGNIGGICVTDPNPPLAIGAIGIGIQNPDNLLDINGPIKIRGGNPGVNKILASDANGLASWTAPIPPFNPIPFKATNNFDQTVPSATIYTLSLNTEEYDPGNNFNASTFTVPATGIYHLDVVIMWNLTGITSLVNLSLIIRISGSTEHGVDTKLLSGANGSYSQMMSCDLSLTVSQTVQIAVYQTSGTNQTIFGNTGGGKLTYLDGHRIN